MKINFIIAFIVIAIAVVFSCVGIDRVNKCNLSNEYYLEGVEY